MAELDVKTTYHPLSGQWTIELRKMGGRLLYRRFASDVSALHVETVARELADFLGATLTREMPEKGEEKS